jgi:hypothetical protein
MKSPMKITSGMTIQVNSMPISVFSEGRWLRSALEPRRYLMLKKMMTMKTASVIRLHKTRRETKMASTRPA